MTVPLTEFEAAYYASLTPRAAGAARRTLDRLVSLNGTVARRADHVLAAVAAGGRVERFTYRDTRAEEKLEAKLRTPRSGNMNCWADEREAANRTRAELDQLRAGVPGRRLPTPRGTYLDELEWGVTAMELAEFVGARIP